MAVLFGLVAVFDLEESIYKLQRLSLCMSMIFDFNIVCFFTVNKLYMVIFSAYDNWRKLTSNKLVWIEFANFLI